MHFLLLLPAALILSAQPAPGQEKTGEDRPAAQEKTAEGMPAGQDNTRLWQSIGLDKTAHFASFRHPVKVAIIDDGFDLDNPLWAASIAHNTKDIPGNDIDDDHNGKVDDYEGWDFGDNDAEVRPARALLDKESHGTRVLGVFWETLQQLSAGAPSGISILPIKAVSDGHLNNYLKEGYKGIEYAIEQKADVIICSWSGPLISPEEKAVLAKAREKGILVIASAGNFYAMQPLYPGAVPSVINVAATSADGRKLPVSNYGAFVDISAPGDSLLTYDPYAAQPRAHLSATSAATPVIGAIVTAIRAAWPELSPVAIERLLKNTATPIDAVNPHYAGGLGAGLVNVAAIREVLTGVAPGPVMSFTQPQGYILLAGLQTRQPVKIVPAGRYPAIKFLLSGASETAPDVRLTLFRDGHSTDTLVRKQALKYPFIASADSLYLYAAAAKSSGLAVAVRPIVHLTPHDNYWYYSAMPIDSSAFYCGGTVDVAASGEGVLEDGSGANNYTGRNDCKWQLTAPESKKILLEFQQFDTEPKIDQVYIFSGNSTKDPILAIFSGHKLPPPIKSWSNSVLIWFITNEENNFQGWKLHYKVVDADPAP
jgi:serine protease